MGFRMVWPLSQMTKNTLKLSKIVLEGAMNEGEDVTDSHGKGQRMNNQLNVT